MTRRDGEFANIIHCYSRPELEHLAFPGCAEACERGGADEILEACALACRDCERTCQTLAGPSDGAPNAPHHD